METNVAQAKRIINALKNGVIPDVNLQLLSAGREKETTEFIRCFDDVIEGNGAVKFVSGEYGSGKSFMLSLVRQLAIEKNFLVSKIMISKGFNLSNMEHLYYNVMHNLSMHTVEGNGTDFEEIFDIWVSKLQSYTDREKAALEIRNVISTLNNFNSSFARAFMVYIKSKTNKDVELSNAVASWIKGEKNIPALLKARFDVKGDIDKQNSIDFLKAFISLVTLLGYNGMVILIDELELVMNIRSDIRKTVYENLRYLVDASGAGEFKKCMFVFAGTNEVFEDSERGMKTYPALYQRLGNGLDKASSSFTNLRKPIMSLKTLNLEDIQILTDRIIQFHRITYSWTPKLSNEAIRNWVLLNFKKSKDSVLPVNTREYLIKLIEILDILEQNPENTLFSSELRLVKKNGIDTFVNATIKPEQDDSV